MKNTLKAFTAVIAPGVILTAIFFTNVIKANSEAIQRSPAVEAKEAKSVKSAVKNYLLDINNVRR